MKLAQELFEKRQGIYFKMLDDLKKMKIRGLQLLDIYFIYKDKESKEDQIVFKIIGEQMDQQSAAIVKLEAQIKEFTEQRFSKSEIEQMKFEYSLRS